MRTTNRISTFLATTSIPRTNSLQINIGQQHHSRMSAVHYIESGITGAAIGIGIHYAGQYYKRWSSSNPNPSTETSTPSKGFPDTSIVDTHSGFNQVNQRSFGTKYNPELARALEDVIIAMGFQEGHLWKYKHDREKVFLFRLKYGDSIVILSSISKEGGAGKKKKPVFIRKTFKIGVIDKLGDYIEDMDFPKMSSVAHSKGKLEMVMNRLITKINAISSKMQEKYQQLDKQPISNQDLEVEGLEDAVIETLKDGERSCSGCGEKSKLQGLQQWAWEAIGSRVSM